MKKTAVILVCALAILCIFSLAVFANVNEGTSLLVGSDCIEAIQDGGFPTGNVKYEDGVVTEALQLYNSSSSNSVESTLYNAIANTVDSVSVEEYNITSTQLKNIMEKLVNDNPELFHVNPSYKYTYYTTTGYIVDVKFTYKMTGSEYSEAYKVYSKEINKIADYVSKLDTELEKIIGVHDYICANYEYDSSYTIRDVYNFIVYKKGVCQSYTLMFSAVMQKLDIDVSWATSEAMNHIWNVVKCGESWYHVDATWDDPNNGVKFYSYHKNILKSDDGITSTGHYGWTTDVICASTTYDNAFWYDYKSPFVPVETDLYFINTDEKSLNCYVSSNLSVETVKTFDYTWYTADGTGYYSGMYSGLSVYNGIIYLNSPEAIVLYNPQNGDIIEFLTPTLDGGYIYTSLVSDGYISFTITDGPVYSSTVYQGELSDYLPEYSVEWIIEGNVETAYVDYGETPIYANGTPSKNYDSEYHYSFISWTPALYAAFSNQSYIAEFETISHTYIDGLCSCGKSEEIIEKIGFVTVPFGIMYYYSDGTFAKGWTMINGKTYRFDPETGLLFTESMLVGVNTYYFNEDHSTVEGIVYEDGGMRYYKKGVRQFGWFDLDGDGANDTYFFVSTQLRCEESRILFDGVDTRRFYKYNPETGFMEVVDGFYTDENGTQFFKNGLGKYGWITSDGENITDKPGITLSNVHYFAYGDGINFYMVEDSVKTIGGVVREFDENHLVKAYTGWATNKTTGNANYYVEGELQQGWFETENGWVYLSRSENLANNITYGDAFYGWRKVGGKVYYFRATTSTPAYVIISDPSRQLTYEGVRSTYYINQTPANGSTLVGSDYYITNPPAGF